MVKDAIKGNGVFGQTVLEPKNVAVGLHSAAVCVILIMV
jgi:hypothetical protein